MALKLGSRDVFLRATTAFEDRSVAVMLVAIETVSSWLHVREIGEGHAKPHKRIVLECQRGFARKNNPLQDVVRIVGNAILLGVEIDVSSRVGQALAGGIVRGLQSFGIKMVASFI